METVIEKFPTAKEAWKQTVLVMESLKIEEPDVTLIIEKIKTKITIQIGKGKSYLTIDSVDILNESLYPDIYFNYQKISEYFVNLGYKVALIITYGREHGRKYYEFSWYPEPQNQ